MVCEGELPMPAPRPRPSRRPAAPMTHDGVTVGVRAWVAEQVRCEPSQLREIRSAVIGTGVREYRYLRAGSVAVVATVARQQPGRYRLRASWSGGSVETMIRGSVSG